MRVTPQRGYPSPPRKNAGASPKGEAFINEPSPLGEGGPRLAVDEGLVSLLNYNLPYKNFFNFFQKSVDKGILHCYNISVTEDSRLR